MKSYVYSNSNSFCSNSFLNSREQECFKVSSLNKITENFSINFRSAAKQLPSQVSCALKVNSTFENWIRSFPWSHFSFLSKKLNTNATPLTPNELIRGLGHWQEKNGPFQNQVLRNSDTPINIEETLKKGSKIQSE